jgi:hypothetical protein
MVMVKLMAKVMAPAVIVLAMGIAAAPVLEAQALQANLDMVAVHKAKNEVFVQLSSTLVPLHGRLTAFDATALTMEVDGRSYTFPSNEVLRIDIPGNHAVRGALIGGIAIAAWCAFICGQGLDNASQVAAVAAVNGGLGAALGGVVGFNHESRKTIYRSAGSGAAISRPPSDLPCPATPLVLEAALSATDLQKLPKTWTPVPQSHDFGSSLCDGVTIQRHYDKHTGVWQPGVEIAAGSSDASSIDVRVRVTVRNAQGGRDKDAHVDLGLRQGGRSQVTSILSMSVDADEVSSRDVALRVPRALLSSSGLSLQVTLTTSYAR